MLIILGYMGCGKSVVGQRVSELLGYRFIDLDHLIEREESMTINQIFREKGSIYFRKKENEYFKRIINSKKKVVLSLGGGTPCYYDHMEIINSIKTIKSFYLNAGIVKLSNRLWDEKDSRPLVADLKSKEELLEFIGKHLFERRVFYLKAQYKIEVDDKSVDQIAQEVTSYLF